MRKAFFAVVLVAASFAGGAVVNGPGLKWAQTMVMKRLGVEDDAADRDQQASSDNSPVDPDNPSNHVAPIAVEPTEITPGSPRTKSKNSVRGKSTTEVKAARSRTPVKAIEPEIAPLALFGPDLEPAQPTPLAANALAPDLTTLGVPETPALDQPPAPLATSREREYEAISRALEVAQASQRDSRENDPRARTSQSTPKADLSLNKAAKALDEIETRPAATPGTWAEIRRTMVSLGVSRYGIEGDPGGKVRFFCVIPIAGRRAVGQHFEADGDDEIQAAQATLKRVSLWRATESQAEER